MPTLSYRILEPAGWRGVWIKLSLWALGVIRVILRHKPSLSLPNVGSSTLRDLLVWTNEPQDKSTWKITFITLGIQLLNLTFSFVLKRFFPKGFLGELQSGAGRANWPCPGGKNAPCVILSKIILKEFIIQLKFWWKLSVQASQVLERLEEGKGEEGLKEDEVRLKPIIIHIPF